MNHHASPLSRHKSRPRRYVPFAVLPAAALLVIVTACGDDGDADRVDLPTTEASIATTSPPATTLSPTDDGVEPVGPDDRPAEPDPADLPEMVAPAGLGVPALPTDADGVVAVFDALPASLLGGPREPAESRPDRISVRYDTGDRRCSDVGFEAFDLTAAEDGFYPADWRAEHFVALFATGADWDVEDAGHEGTRYWVTFETYCGGEDMEQDEIISSAIWGEEGSPWVFSVGAPDTSGRDVLLTAFVDAALLAAPTPE